jgi:hypothetical protein
MFEHGPAGPFVKSFGGSGFAFLRAQQPVHSSVVRVHNPFTQHITISIQVYTSLVNQMVIIVKNISNKLHVDDN